ncbi:hypothetical protein EI555_009947 [Monodon monoceros]|uniref:NADH-ubiquinone oxidoreductase chain 5 n=1 Tax=Monodon monoceros TaxID=40151 RepID=A0A4U1FK98_MONMO|nr:hypothetical protein EI555_009947 [Monodon monoceros]
MAPLMILNSHFTLASIIPITLLVFVAWEAALGLSLLVIVSNTYGTNYFLHSLSSLDELTRQNALMQDSIFYSTHLSGHPLLVALVYIQNTMGANIVLTALYSLHILVTTQCGKYTHHINNITPSFPRENALITLHILPLLLLSLNPQIILGPLYFTLLILTIPIIIINTNLYKSDKNPSYAILYNLIRDIGFIINRRPYSCISLTPLRHISRGRNLLAFSILPLTENNKHSNNSTMLRSPHHPIRSNSQLGLIIVTVDINQPYLVFLHICTHAFFKAILFIYSGSIIHSLNDKQDIQKIGGQFKAIPFTTTALIIGTVCSAGVIFFPLLGQPHFSPLTSINENNPFLVNSIKCPLIGSVFAGFIISNNIPPTTVPLITVPPYLKLTALNFKCWYRYFPTIMHRLPPYLNLSISQNSASSLLDLIWLENVLPKTTSLIQLKLSTLVSSQKGLIKLYFLSFLIILLLSMLLFNYHG